MRYWPLNRMSFLSSHHDVFKDVPAGKAGDIRRMVIWR